MKRLKIAQYIALGGMACELIGLIVNKLGAESIGGNILAIGIYIGMVSYIFGGFFTAIKMAAKIAVWGWRVVAFPFDLMTFGFAFIFAIMAFLFLPIIPVRKAYKESM